MLALKNLRQNSLIRLTLFEGSGHRLMHPLVDSSIEPTTRR